jgi:hypothetical protein
MEWFLFHSGRGDMVSRQFRQLARPVAILAMALLMLGLIAPTGTIAAQSEAATPVIAEPVPPDPQPATDDESEGDFGAAAVDSARFDQENYYLNPDALGALIIQMAGITTGGTFVIPAVTGLVWSDPIATTPDSAATCTVVQGVEGGLTGTFANTAISPASCQISFTLTAPSFFPGGTISGTVDWNNGTSTGVSSNVPFGGGGVSLVIPAFGQDLYTAVIGEPFQIEFTITLPGYKGFGDATIPHPAFLDLYTEIEATSNDSTNVSDCEATLEPNGEITLDYNIPPLTPTPFTCTVRFTTAIAATVGDGESTTLSVPVYVAPGGGSDSAQTTIVGYAPSSQSMTLALGDTTPAAGDQVSVTATQTHNSSTETTGTMQVNLPDGATYADGSAEVTCAPVACTGAQVVPSGDSIVITYDGAADASTVTLDFDVTIDGNALSGTELAFDANGEVGTGLAAQRTGPASASLTVTAAPLTTTELTTSATPGETITGTLTGQVSGGTPEYTFSLLNQAGQGIATVNEDGTFSYQANTGATGTDSFTYTVTDSQVVQTGIGAAATTTGTVNVTIIAPGETPSVTPTTEATVAPSPTAGTGTVGPGRPQPGATQTPVPDDGDDDGNGADDATGPGGATTLPSTGSGANDDSSLALLGLAGAALLLLASLVAYRRRA